MLDHKKELTIRQQQLLRHIARGGSSEDFANVHCIALKTVYAHRYNLMREIDCHNPAQVTAYAIKFGYIQLSSIA